jgi:hypothetical protein
MARVYRVSYKGQVYWIPESGGCEDADDAAAKVTGCRPGVNCFVSTRFTGNLTPEEYIAQQEAQTPATTTPETPEATKPKATTTKGTTTPTTPTTPETTTPTTTTKPSTTKGTEDVVGEYSFDLGYCTAPVPPPNPIDNWMKIPLSPGVYYAGAGAGYPSDDGSIYGSEWTSLYVGYWHFLEEAGDNWPRPKDINEFIINYDQWTANQDYYRAGFTQKQIDDYQEFQLYASRYGNLEDWTPTSLEDYLTNYDKAQQQLTAWKQEAGPEAVGFTDEQIREYNAYKQYYYKYGEPGDWVPVDVGDFVTNYETAQEQLSKWQGQEEEIGEYELSPEEAARRREEAYAESRYAAQERYGEPARLSETFSAWMGQQDQLSGAFSQFVESKYPSLRGEFEAGMPVEKGYPTREEARAAALERESQWQAWLPEQVPGVYQEYMSKPPLQRGERPYMYQKTLRTANW